MSKDAMTTTGAKGGFLMLKDFSLAEAISDELNGLNVGFDRIKIPSGGSTVYEVPGEEPGQTDTVKEFSAVILFHHPVFTMYRNKYTGGNNPPDCGSFDGKTGNGNPGGNCASCPFNKFDSGENGSKACKNKRNLYVLREGEIFPLLLSLPVGSIKAFELYIKRVLGAGWKKSNAVVTQFSLQKATNAKGLVYSQALFTFDRGLSAEEHALVAPFAEQLKGYSQHVGYELEAGDETEIPYTIDPVTGEIIE